MSEVSTSTRSSGKPRTSRSRASTVALALLGLLGSLLVVVLGPANPAAASHYRANQLTWHVHSGRDVEFAFGGSWRCTFYFNDPCSANVGDTFSGPYIDFGDGESQQLTMTVTSVDVTNDVVTGMTETEHTYATDGPFTAAVSDCCRLSPPQHINNPDGNIRIQTVVDLSATSASPTSSIAPIVDCPLNAECKFTVPAADPDGQSMRWRLSTSDEAGPPFAQPGPPFSINAASINAATGQYTWDTTGAQVAPSGSTFYSTQVTIENVVNNVVVATTPVDFFIRLGSNSTNQQPIFVSPTLDDGAVITGVTGSPVSFAVAATDPDTGDTVTPAVINKPADATFTPVPGNPASGQFSWTPTTPGDYLLTLTATDQAGLGAVPRGITLRIGNPSPTNRAPTANAQSVETPVDTPLAITLTGSDPDGDAVTYAVQSAPTHGSLTGTAPNLTYTPNAGYVGPDSFTFTTNDGSLSSDPATVDITVTQPNRAPTANAQSVTTPADTPATIVLTGSDADSDPLTYQVASGPTHGTLSGSDDTLLYTPNPGYSGPDSFTFTTNDGALSSAPATVSITVTAPACTSTAPTLDVQVSGDFKAGMPFVAPKLSTSGKGELIVASVAAGGSRSSAQSVAAVYGGGLKWARAARANTGVGTSEIWWAYSAGKVTNAVIKAAFAKGGYSGSLTVAAFKGAYRVGGTAVGAGQSSQPKATVKAAALNSLVWGSGHSYGAGVAPSVPSGQSMVHAYTDTKGKGAFWTQAISGTTTAKGSYYTVRANQPGNDRWTLAAAEIVPRPSGSGCS